MRNALLPLFFMLPLSACVVPLGGAQAGGPDASASSRSTAPPGQNVPQPLQYFVGDWLVTARDPSTNEVITITYKVEPSMGGRWLAGNGESADLSVRARDFWGVDPASGAIMRFVFDSSGAYGIVRSRGWEGERLVLEGEALSRGGPTRVRETITRIGPNRFEAVWEALQDGAWRAYSIEQVTRQ